MENLIHLKDLKLILLGAVMLQKWNDDKGDFDIVYSNDNIYGDEDLYNKFGEMTIAQMYSFADDNGDYLVIIIE